MGRVIVVAQNTNVSRTKFAERLIRILITVSRISPTGVAPVQISRGELANAHLFALHNGPVR